MVTYKKEKGIEPKGVVCGCGSCKGGEKQLSLDTLLSVGFGETYAEKGKEKVYSEMEREQEGLDLWRLKDLERLAKVESEEDWRLHFIGAYKEQSYQRQGEGKWVLYAEGEGIV